MARIATMAVFSVMVTLVALSAFAAATEYIVGDAEGWTLGFDYGAWAAGKTFRIGDTLVFKYAQGSHTVVIVNGTGFSKCETSPNMGLLGSGNDRITLTTTGNKWYICGVGTHCDKGQKLKITVLPKMMIGSPSPAPSPQLSFPWEPLIPAAPAFPPTEENNPGSWLPFLAPAPAPTSEMPTGSVISEDNKKWSDEAPAPAPEVSIPELPWQPQVPASPPTTASSPFWSIFPESPVPSPQSEWTELPFELVPSPEPEWEWQPLVPVPSPQTEWASSNPVGSLEPVA